MREKELAKYVFSLLKSAVYKDHDYLIDFENVNWEEIYEAAEMNSLVPILFDEIVYLSKKYTLPPNYLEDWKERTLAFMLFEYDKYGILRTIIEQAKLLEITCVFFKGCVLADLYPKYASRTSSDTDIYVFPKDREKAIQMFEGLGYEKIEAASKEMVYVYHLEEKRHKVELHFSLWEDYTGEKIDLIDRMNIVSEDTLIDLEVCGINVTTLGYEEHLIFQIFHIVKHFSLEGIGIRYLVDIALYVNRYQKYINFESFWEKMEKLGYAVFSESVFSIAIEYLGMSDEIMFGRKRISLEELDYFLADLIHVGAFSDDKYTSWELLTILSPYFVGEKVVTKSKILRKIKIFFPGPSDLPEKYEYARKYKLLLIFAWIHKYFDFISRWIKNRGNKYNVNEKLVVVEERINLMEKLGLLDGGEKNDKKN